ncbi:hypothetical protein P3T76_005524 [Phytophthora citrophthora]|uniref:Uncharacterized protein n=1 Tax=Phytophthora citrophthora TaxID=4793 RepID=A0AAD9GQE1_9STRA|nr:hypothetical protein P3T76_005524 [Phytophthora citrophthora]
MLLPRKPRQNVIGFVFDTTAETVAIPAAKISKAKRLVVNAYHAANLSRSEFRWMLVSLHHIATCRHPAQVFLKRFRYFAALPEPDFVASTDASDFGVCSLVASLRLSLTYSSIQKDQGRV